MTKRRNMPLDGVVVLDLGQVYQGPYATYMMAKAGATVIKIEPLQGESVRQRQALSKGSGAPFAMLNGHKKCITLDLKSEEGKDIFRRLVVKADVVVENFAPGVMDRLGLGWEALHKLNPRLVYGSATGFGLSGPDRDNLAMDITVQASSGMMSVTGFPDGPPVKAGPAVVDFMSGTHLYAGVLTALYEREKTGQGRLVEIAMQETVFASLASSLNFYYDHQTVPPRTGNSHSGLSAAPYGVYAVKDGHVAIIGLTDRHWSKLLGAMGRGDLANDTRYMTKVSRVRHIQEVDRIVNEWTSKGTRQEICDLLKHHEVPHAPVRNAVEVANDAHMHERKALEWIDHPESGRIVIPDSPLRFHGADRLPAVASAKLGAHTKEVLMDFLGLQEAQVNELAEHGVINSNH